MDRAHKIIHQTCIDEQKAGYRARKCKFCNKVATSRCNRLECTGCQPPSPSSLLSVPEPVLLQPIDRRDIENWSCQTDIDIVSDRRRIIDELIRARLRPRSTVVHTAQCLQCGAEFLPEYGCDCESYSDSSSCDSFCDWVQS